MWPEHDLVEAAVPAGDDAGGGTRPPSAGGPSACYANHDNRFCTLPRGHYGRHEAHGPLPADTLLYWWDQ